MNELESLIERHYQKRKKETFSMEMLLEMVENVFDEFTPIISEETAPRATTIDTSKTYDLSLVPMPQFSELEWGTLTTPKDGGTRPSSDPRAQLAQYMENIGGEGLRGKIESLNKFYSGEMSPENFSSESDKISKYLSYLVVYKTLTSIFTGFNAASAGFLFEPWLAIMLDAETGQQIPAAGADTIADFTIEKGERPISLKAYSHGSLKVGGSFRQLIEDLTGKNPVMEYIAVTKDMEGDKGEPMSVTGKLHFRSFNFTFENVADIIYKVSTGKHKKILELPKAFWDSRIAELSRDEEFLEKIRTPKKAELNIPKLFDQYEEIFRQTFSEFDLDDSVTEEALKDFYDYIVSRETGDYRKTKANHLKKPVKPTTHSRSLWVAFMNQWPVVADDPDATSYKDLLPVMQEIHERWVELRSSSESGAARGEKTEQLEYQSPEKTYARLKELQEMNTETYRLALRHLRGVIFNDQFDLTESSLDKNISSVGGENLFSYGQYYIGTITVGRSNVQQILERCINELNTSILDIFASLRGLTDNINRYVANGLQDDRLITDPQDGARAEAQNIDKKTGEIVEK